MQLIDDVSDYVATFGIADISAYQYRNSVRCFGEYLRRPAVRRDLVTQSVNRWLRSLDRSPKTIKNRLRGITPVWNWLADRGLVERYDAREIARIRVPKKPPVAWSIESVNQLLLSLIHI